MTEQTPIVVEEIWVNTTEGEQITGYHRRYLQLLARKFSKLPENERLIRIRRRTSGYELWLPDIITYIELHGYGPRNPDSK